MEENTIHIISFTRERGKLHMWLGKLMARYPTNIYYFFITSAKNKSADDTNETQQK